MSMAEGSGHLSSYSQLCKLEPPLEQMRFLKKERLKRRVQGQETKRSSEGDLVKARQLCRRAG